MPKVTFQAGVPVMVQFRHNGGQPSEVSLVSHIDTGTDFDGDGLLDSGSVSRSNASTSAGPILVHSGVAIVDLVFDIVALYTVNPGSTATTLTATLLQGGQALSPPLTHPLNAASHGPLIFRFWS